MIRLTRVRTAPPVHNNFYGIKRVALNLVLLKLKQSGALDVSGTSDKWNSSIWKEAKPQLVAETGGKCAYCETPFSVVDYGDVEHFRPKSKYWWLAYCYENYLASCALCNQKFKSDDFFFRKGYKRMPEIKITAAMSEKRLQLLAPLLTVDPVNESEGLSYKEFENSMATEWALLVNPYFDEPSEYYAYKAILETREVHVVPAKKQYTDVVQAACDLIGTNRKELLDLRFQWYCLYMTYRHTLADAGINANTRLMNQNRLKEMAKGHQAYTGMVRYFDTQNLETLPWKFDIMSSEHLIFTAAP